MGRGLHWADWYLVIRESRDGLGVEVGALSNTRPTLGSSPSKELLIG